MRKPYEDSVGRRPQQWITSTIIKGTKSHTTQREANLIIAWVELNIPALSAAQIPVLENWQVDFLSHQCLFPEEQSLHQEVSQDLCRRWVTPDVDFLASRFNNKLDNILSHLHCRIEREGVLKILIAPDWQGRMWCVYLIIFLADVSWTLSNQSDHLSQRQVNWYWFLFSGLMARLLGPKSWETGAYLSQSSLCSWKLGNQLLTKSIIIPERPTLRGVRLPLKMLWLSGTATWFYWFFRNLPSSPVGVFPCSPSLIRLPSFMDVVSSWHFSE